MCVIIYKPVGVEIPSKALLNKAQYINPHGCGFCTPTQSYKGLSYNQFLKKLSKVDKSEPLLIHFRLATHGSIRKGNCHPFYDNQTDTQFMHNGILYGVRPNKDLTDSECAFRWFIQPLINKYGLFSNEVTNEVNKLIGLSKFALMQGDNVKLFGDFICSNDLYFSNQRFIH